MLTGQKLTEQRLTSRMRPRARSILDTGYACSRGLCRPKEVHVRRVVNVALDQSLCKDATRHRLFPAVKCLGLGRSVRLLQLLLNALRKAEFSEGQDGREAEKAASCVCGSHPHRGARIGQVSSFRGNYVRIRGSLGVARGWTVSAGGRRSCAIRQTRSGWL
ncbi:uncharacterized protein SCHCODRAFT_02368194 [Schizophyllum commune H4-8]|uniref:uncharacterized protein n=1 Tax=Schizophyllum commune (strain H4-8 / FGSC 9210) TaxID=578458 RepID=UPI00215E8C3F|nr:uncharacterized protein SCHCODRAFT_02368194 [Schizophyllum commune H4-8]KAI5889459.1 hypothetical protein SCHCODRAFT_02368194 [Schizophyllum commune H4-8]